MKEKIYTIPVNEAFDTDLECPLCYLKKKLEQEAVDYSLGGAMMEPDYRIISNEKGYCNTHYAMMLPKKEKLSLALVLDTHIEELRGKMDVLELKLSSGDKKGIFGKKTDSLAELCDALDAMSSSCVICDKLNSTMERYISVVFYLWEKEAEFKDKLIKSHGFCLEHLSALIRLAKKHLSAKRAEEFIRTVFDKEKTELARLQDEVHRFTLKFDYRSRGEKWGSEIDAPKRAVEKLSGYLRD